MYRSSSDTFKIIQALSNPFFPLLIDIFKNKERFESGIRDHPFSTYAKFFKIKKC